MQRQNTKRILINLIVVFVFVFSPTIIYSEKAPAPTNGLGTGITYECGASPSTLGNCDFNDLMRAINEIVDYGMTLALSLSVVVIAVAGAKYMLGADNASERKKANEMLRKAAMGIAFMLAAWLIVTLITNALLIDEIKGLVPLR